MGLIQQLMAMNILQIIIFGYIINIILGIISVIKALILIKRQLKLILVINDVLKPLMGIREKYLSWSRKHLILLSLIFPFGYILMTIKELYFLYIVHYNIVYFLIYDTERELLISSRNLANEDKKIINSIKEKLHYPQSLSLIDTNK